ncbi:collagen-binding protein [Sphingobacterium sp. ML3W]|uniref:SusC/RagA family TonB-linked outer membrane protein n=1 Tax=Sphingobacterium sp. ML3W TaxID=1538644 RepID=UPI0004F8AA23|nr:SusC/RagA family TonB-linked outer membrane protein [Sphingobacterium sp. ML3W]AIM35813.1 collagen-binding protein [Sphingobacterium sp. ML3W]
MSYFYKKSAGLALCTLFSASSLFAQQTITGTVTDATGPVSGVTVSVKGTARGTQTSANGTFTIQAAAGETLRFSNIGYKATEIVVGSTKTINVSLVQDSEALGEVVVTAMGIKREKKALGYSFQEVKSEQLLETKENNIANALVGKVSGLQVIKGSNGPASSTKLTLRGNNSLTGDNQPLIIVDGVPVNNFIGAKNNDYWNPSLDMGSGLGDINPEDIESMSVLKSGAASAIYGSRAGNGAIVITTKSGKLQKGTGITFSSTLGLESIFMTPEIQNNFGQGKDGVGEKTSTENWGPEIETAYDNIGNFFKTGINHTQNLSFQQQIGENTNVYTSATYLNDDSKIPGSTFRRINLLSKVNTTFGPNKRWITDVKVQYMNTEALNRPQAGQNSSNVYSTLFRMPRDLNILDFKNPINEDGKMNWYGTSNSTNPYWLAKYRLNQDVRDRYIMNANIKYVLTDWLDVEGRVGSDRYSTNYNDRIYSGSPLATTGRYSLGKNTFFENNYTIALNARKDDLVGKWGGSASLFGQIMNTKETGLSANAGDLQVPDIFTINNGKNNPSVDETFYRKQINSLYATAEIDYDNFWFINLTGRNDWSSALLEENRSFFYPSVSTSLILSEMISKNGGTMPSWLNFTKLRASYAAVGNDLRSYKLFNVYSTGKDPDGNTVANRDNTKYNPNIVSELIKTVEAGFELRMFNSRLGFDFSWYKTNATNQLIALPMNPMSGYSFEMVNAGNIQNQGIEIMLNGTILDNKEGLSWNTSVNFSKNKNKIISLTSDRDYYPLGGFDNVAVRAVTGSLYGDILGTKFLRVTDEKSPYLGQLLLDGNGLPQATSEIEKLGNQSPTALVGWTNSFNYKNFAFNFQIDGRFGGEFFSGTNVALQGNGTAAATVIDGKRDNFIVDGVFNNNGKLEQNNKEVSPQRYWKAIAENGNLGIGEANIYDATNIRLRNVNLTYSLPSTLFKGNFIQRAKIGITANNVWMIKSYGNGVDPESVFSISSNASGFENFSTPTSRSYFFNVTLGF